MAGVKPSLINSWRHLSLITPQSRIIQGLMARTHLYKCIDKTCFNGGNRLLKNVSYEQKIFDQSSQQANFLLV